MLAASAGKAGWRCRVIDLFADLDTEQFAEKVETVIGQDDGQVSGFHPEALLAAIARLDPQACCPVIYGSGFEANPETTARLSQQRQLFGNSAQTVRQLKQPRLLADLLKKLAIPHPEIRFEQPHDSAHWLQKRSAACGGFHVQKAGRYAVEATDTLYYQRFVSGRNLSATWLSNGRKADLIGLCEQFHADLPDYPFNYGGAISIAADALAQSLLSELNQAAQQLTRQSGLTGLWGFDFITDGADWWLIEVNPRPCATLELHEGSQHSLLNAHIDAFYGHLPEQAWYFSEHRGHAIVYPGHEILIPLQYNWPVWSSDWPQPGTRIRPGQPLCSVHACGDSPTTVYNTLALKQKIILSELNNGD